MKSDERLLVMSLGSGLESSNVKMEKDTSRFCSPCSPHLCSGAALKACISHNKDSTPESLRELSMAELCCGQRYVPGFDEDSENLK